MYEKIQKKYVARYPEVQEIINRTAGKLKKEPALFLPVFGSKAFSLVLLLLLSIGTMVFFGYDLSDLLSVGSSYTDIFSNVTFDSLMAFSLLFVTGSTLISAFFEGALLSMLKRGTNPKKIFSYGKEHFIKLTGAVLLKDLLLAAAGAGFTIFFVAFMSSLVPPGGATCPLCEPLDPLTALGPIPLLLLSAVFFVLMLAGMFFLPFAPQFAVFQSENPVRSVLKSIGFVRSSGTNAPFLVLCILLIESILGFAVNSLFFLPFVFITLLMSIPSTFTKSAFTFFYLDSKK